MRPEIGRVQGVETWADGDPYCTIVCSAGHKRRTVERIKWNADELITGEHRSGRGALYTAGVRVELDRLEDDPGTSAELNPATDEYKWRLRCACGRADVALSRTSLDKLAKGLYDLGVAEIELSRLAVIVS